MSSDTLPISGSRFAAALKDLSLASLHLKNLELRNSLAHLAHSNAQLRPYADGTETSLHGVQGQPDLECVEAIRENEVVTQRIRERLALIRAEVEERGVSWREFEGGFEDDEPGVVGGERQEEDEEEEEDQRASNSRGASGSVPLTNGVLGVNGNGAEVIGGVNANSRATAARGGNPWTDGTFQTGVIRNGEVHMDAVPGQTAGGGAAAAAVSSTATSTAATGGGAGGRLTDEELRRLLEERLAEDGGDDEDEGLYL